jgi:hypothetical protein
VARKLLAERRPRYGSPLKYAQLELDRLLDNLKEAVFPLDWPAKLAEALRESRANERLILAWLDARKAPQDHD